MSFVNQFVSGNLLSFSIIPDIHMDLGAGSTGSGFTHFPEIILFGAVENPGFR